MYMDLIYMIYSGIFVSTCICYGPVVLYISFPLWLSLHSFIEVTKEVKDPQVFVPPAFCDGVPLEPEGNTFFGVFLKQAHLSWNCVLQINRVWFGWQCVPCLIKPSTSLLAMLTKVKLNLLIQSVAYKRQKGGCSLQLCRQMR